MLLAHKPFAARGASKRLLIISLQAITPVYPAIDSATPTESRPKSKVGVDIEGSYENGGRPSPG